MLLVRESPEIAVAQLTLSESCSRLTGFSALMSIRPSHRGAWLEPEGD